MNSLRQLDLYYGPREIARQHRYDALGSYLPTYAAMQPLRCITPRDNARQNHAVAVLEEFARKPVGFVTLMGHPGRGKSHLAAAACLSAREEGYPFLWMNSTAIFNRIRDSYDSGERNGNTDESTFSLARLLVIDDYGTEKPTEWVAEKMNSLIASRYRENRPTILTTNLSPDAFPDRDFSRIADKNTGRLILVCGDDARLGVDTVWADDNDFRFYHKREILCSVCSCRPHSPVCSEGRLS